VSEAPSLESERLVLRSWRDADLAPYTRLLADREVMRHLGAGWRYTVKRAAAQALAVVSDIEARRDLSTMENHWDRLGCGEWAVEERSSGALVGRIGFKHHPDFDADRSKVEIGWMLARRVWGHGYATEGAALALAHAFERLGLQRVISITTPDNERSLGVMRRLGMTPEGRTRWHGFEVVWSAIDRPRWETGPAP
jgi:RimJ/RimL family protein N-acetyltransferase